MSWLGGRDSKTQRFRKPLYPPPAAGGFGVGLSAASSRWSTLLEASFYRELAHTLSVCRPFCYHAQYHPATGNYVVLLEDLGDSVVVSIRDDGVGIPAGRLDQAVSEGRVGVAKSIVGRMNWLGGRAELSTGPGSGTEWELTVPRQSEKPR